MGTLEERMKQIHDHFANTPPEEIIAGLERAGLGQPSKCDDCNGFPEDASCQGCCDKHVAAVEAMYRAEHDERVAVLPPLPEHEQQMTTFQRFGLPDDITAAELMEFVSGRGTCAAVDTEWCKRKFDCEPCFVAVMKAFGERQYQKGFADAKAKAYQLVQDRLKEANRFSAAEEIVRADANALKSLLAMQEGGSDV
jgi:hypothetical protein